MVMPSITCPSAHMDGAYEKVLARAHGARLALRLLPPYRGVTENIERDPRVAFCVDDQVVGEYPTLYGEAVIVAGERVTELTWPLLLAYMHPAEATARWERINADGSRVVIVLRPVSVTGREQVK
jgi:hypothetical protein